MSGIQLAIEEWRPIAGYPKYRVSSLGNVESLNRKTEGKLLKTMDYKKMGYLKVELSNDIQHGKAFFVHRLVALAFIPNPENKPQVNHKNFNPSDNRVENLEWCTQAENQRYTNNSGRKRRNNTGEKKKTLSYLTDKQVRKIKFLLATGHQLRPLAKLFNTSRRTLAGIKNNEVWTDVKMRHLI